MSKLDSYNNIPSEIWCKITQQLSQRDLIECQKVCKLWYLSIRQYCWENIELKSVEHIESFLNYFPKDARKIVKNITIGDQYLYCNPPIEYTLSNEQTKELLLNLPNIENIYIANSFSKNIITELNNEEFLTEFRKNCPNIQSFQAFGISKVVHDYINILYSLKNTITNIVLENKPTFQQMNSFSQLKCITMDWVTGYMDRTDITFLEFLYKIKMLPHLKHLYFNAFLNFKEMDMAIILRIVKEDQILKERLASLEKLRLMFAGMDNNEHLYCTSIIKQYCIGLKKIDLIYNHLFDLPLADRFSDEWANFIFSHDKYKLAIYESDNCRFADIIDICLKNSFTKYSANDRKALKHLWLALDCPNYSKLSPCYYDYLFEFGTAYGLEFESKEIDDNQFLNSTKIYLMDSENTLIDLYEILNSEKYVIKDINTLTLEFIDNTSVYRNMIDLKERYLVAYNTLRLTDQILSLTTDILKKVIIKTENYCRWSKYFVKYEKIKTYRQVTHLDVYVRANNGELLDELTLSQLIVVFPCIKYLTLEYSHIDYPDCIPKSDKVVINLPELKLKKLALDTTIFKLMAQDAAKTQKDFFDTYFMLKIEANEKSYYYQISLDFLNVTELMKSDEESNIANSPQVHIILKNIECLELYLTSTINIENEGYCNSFYFNPYFTMRERSLEHRIYFE